MHSKQFYRIQINSSKMISGTIGNGWYYIDIPEALRTCLRLPHALRDGPLKRALWPLLLITQ